MVLIMAAFDGRREKDGPYITQPQAVAKYEMQPVHLAIQYYFLIILATFLAFHVTFTFMILVPCT
jgi:hypothetical protein